MTNTDAPSYLEEKPAGGVKTMSTGDEAPTDDREVEIGKGAPVVDKEVEILIVGFGFAVIPLLRELERRGKPYTLLSTGPTIWQRLKAKGKLDFNLVSSFHASYYAEDQIKDGRLQDFFPTAQEFYEYQQTLLDEFNENRTEDRVTFVENYPNHSIVYTESGTVYKAENVVFATGLGRPQNEAILDFDWGCVKDKTVVFNTIGDTANMMLAKMVPNGNKIILVHNGFVMLEKDLCANSPGPDNDWYVPIAGFRLGKKYRLDLAQMECHTVGINFPKFWGRIMMLATGPPGPGSWLTNKLLTPHLFFIKFPQTFRKDTLMRNFHTKAGFSNGVIGIKCHSIDMYQLRYGGKDNKTLEENVRQGHLMNDIVFFHDQGLVESWPKLDTSVDKDNKTVSLRSTDGTVRTVGYDHFVEGGHEAPNLPKIVSVDEDGTKHQFRYRYRENYLGVVPSRLHNIFFVGFTRPLSGGAANMNEMQGMMVDKLLSDPKFKANMYSNLDEQLRNYNEFYYADPDETLPTDHLVFYGLYTHEVAKFLGIERPILQTAFSSYNPITVFRNLQFEFLYPNNSIKFRMDGEYKIEGAEKYVRDVFAFTENMVQMMFVLLDCLWDRLLGFLCIAMLFLEYGIKPLLAAVAPATLTADIAFVSITEDDSIRPALVAFVAMAVVSFVLLYLLESNLHYLNLQTYSLPVLPFFGIKAHTQPLMMLYAAVYGEWYWLLGIFGFWCVVAFLGRQFHILNYSGRYLFGDCKYKYKYLPFWEEYKRVYHTVYGSSTEKGGDNMDSNE